MSVQNVVTESWKA